MCQFFSERFLDQIDHLRERVLNAAQQVATRSRCSAPGARREAGGGRGFVPHGSEERKRSGGAGGPGRIPG